MKILVTGTAGFIGFHLVRRLCDRGDEVFGIDNINAYYDVDLKYGRLAATGIPREAADAATPAKPAASNVLPSYRFARLDVADSSALLGLAKAEGFDALCHLAAQAGVRYSLTDPFAYTKANVEGFLSVLEACRHAGVVNLSYASSSSVYGLNTAQPYSTSHSADHPVSLYAASKRANELMAHTYSHLYGIATTGLRFFTVYGPWGRPDMAPTLFASAISRGEPIKVNNHGNMARDFTYIDDIVEGLVRVIDSPAAPDGGFDPLSPTPDASTAPYRLYNIGRGAPVGLMDFIGAIEKAFGRAAEKQFMPLQPGDVRSTFADTTDMERDFGYAPRTDLQTGVGKFITWFKEFYHA